MKTVLWLSIDQIITFTTITTATNRQEIKSIPWLLSLLMWNNEETRRHPRIDAITTHNRIFYLRCNSSHLFISFCKSSYPIKGMIVREEDMLFYDKWSCFPSVIIHCVPRVPFPLPHISIPSSIPLSILPPFLSLSYISSQKQIEDILDRLVSSKASLHVQFKVFILSSLPWLIVQFLHS